MRSAYAKTDTGRWIEDAGLVQRLLPDDDGEDGVLAVAVT